MFDHERGLNAGTRGEAGAWARCGVPGMKISLLCPCVCTPVDCCHPRAFALRARCIN